MRLVMIGKHAHRKGNIRHVRTWSQAISNNFSCLFRSKIAKIAKDKCSHCAMDLDYCFRWLSPAPSHRIIVLWVHPFRVRMWKGIAMSRVEFMKCPKYMSLRADQRKTAMYRGSNRIQIAARVNIMHPKKFGDHHRDENMDYRRDGGVQKGNCDNYLYNILHADVLFSCYTLGPGQYTSRNAI